VTKNTKAFYIILKFVEEREINTLDIKTTNTLVSDKFE